MILYHYREPRRVNVGLYLYHALTLATGLAAVIGPQPLGLGKPGPLDDWADWLWCIMFGLLGLTGLVARTLSWLQRDTWGWTLLEARTLLATGIAMASAVIGELLSNAIAHPGHPDWLLSARFAATATLMFVAGMTESSFLRQRLRLSRFDSDQKAARARGLREQLCDPGSPHGK